MTKEDIFGASVKQEYFAISFRLVELNKID